MESVLDPNSSATAAHVCTQIDWSASADFGTHVLTAIVVLKFRINDPTVRNLTLDTRDLVIDAVNDKDSGQTLSFSLGSAHPAFGTPLSIDISPLHRESGESFAVAIKYKTSPGASAIQWLAPEQTAGKAKPFLFTQCQAIHARSLLPCQDTPAIKAPYTARVTVRPGLTALMSAESVGTTTNEDGTNTFSFRQTVCIPAYLMALVIGDLQSKEISPRVRVWAEPSVVEKAAFEFSEAETMLATAEALLGPYVWGRYDLLVLPPSFPYGGMENPMLTFVTPTLLAGDRSLATVVAHEIAHSWTGNLVTNKSWEHFWLNEGFTVFVERKIIGRMHGENARHFHAIGGHKCLCDAVQGYGADHPFTCLVHDLKDKDPDDAFSSIPYEKGFYFLFYLEQLLGGPDVFDKYLRAHVEKHAYQSITTDQWRAFLYEYFADKKDVLDAIDWHAWLHTPGMPPVVNQYDDSLAVAARLLADVWVTAVDPAAIDAGSLSSFSSQQQQEFLNRLLTKAPLPHPTLATLDVAYKLSESKNSEIALRWQQLCLASSYAPIIPHVVDFITSQGRMKYVRPLYKALHKCEAAGTLARDTFVAHRSFYHNIAATMLAKDLGLP
eukprot:m.232660 g.232660  ORF g.232660 m.232660 type:complete len:609 (-) comp18819_c0_seq1:206-2032(-)